MKRFIKKAGAVLMSAAMLAGVCVVNTSSVSAMQASNPDFNEKGFPISKKPITLQFIANTTSNSTQPEKFTMMATLEKLTGIKANFVYLEEQQFDVFLAAGKYPDFFYAMGGEANLSRRLANYGVAGGKFVNWAIYADLMPNLQQMYKEEPMTKKMSTEVNGEIYALAMANKAPTSVTTRMMIRTDYLDTLGVKMPKSVDEFYTTLKAAYDKGLTKGFSPLLPYDSGAFNSRMEPFFFASFGKAVDPGYDDDGTGKVVFNRISDQYKYYLTYMNKLFKDKVLENEYLTLDRSTTLARERAGTSMCGTEFTSIVPADFPSKKMDIDQVPPLTSQYDNTMKTKEYNYYRVAGGVMPKTTKYQKEIARYVDLWYSKTEIAPDTGIMRESFIYGVKGKDYDIKGTELFQYVPKEYGTMAHGNYLNEYVKPTHIFGWYDNMAMGGTDNSLARQKGYVKNNIPYQKPYFPVNEMKFKAEELDAINNNSVEINNYVTEMRAKFIAGVANIDTEWTTYVNTIKKMKLDAVIKAYQAAYDRWNKS